MPKRLSGGLPYRPRSRYRSRWLIRVFVVLALSLPVFAAAEPPLGDPGVRVTGTTFHVFRDGHELAQDALVGAEFVLRDDQGVRQVVRIDEAVRDPADRAGEIMLYRLSVRNPQTGEWQNMCRPGPDGIAMGFPIEGSWTADGRHVHDNSLAMTCSAGAIGKCIRYGYKPWAAGPNGAALWDYHQACTRMVRADYCGDGTSWTRDGMAIDLFDRLGIQVPDTTDTMQFEAAWDARGAVCVSHTRVQSRITLDALLKHCPDRLRIAPAACTDAATAGRDDVLIRNESFFDAD
jgi:hypothetical protein